jgi:arylformamidase
VNPRDDTLAEGWIDVSVPLSDGMPAWPANPPVKIRRHEDMSKGGDANVTALSFGAHTGTHMDAPVHFLADGVAIDAMDLSATMGEARVIEIDDPAVIQRHELQAAEISRGERILFKTRNSSYAWTSETFVEDFVGISLGAAEYLAELGVRTVGIDYLSVAPFGGDAAGVHRALLSAGVWVIEGLDLSPVAEGSYELICLPLSIPGSDGGPARALLRPLDRGH